MRDAIAAARFIVGTALRVDPARAVPVLVLGPLLGVAGAVQGLSLAWIVDAALAHRPGQALRGTVLLVVAVLVTHQFGAVIADLRLVLQQKVGLELDRRMMQLCAGRPHIDHHLDPDYLDRFALLRERRAELDGGLAALVENARAVVRLGSLLAVLLAASPALLVLPLFAVPAVIAARREQTMLVAAERATAETDRHRADLFTLACDPAAARELRLYRLGDRIADRHRAALAAVNRARFRAAARGAAGSVVAWLVFCAGLFGAAAVVVHSVFVGARSPGEAVLVLTLGTRFTGATTSLTSLASWFGRTLDTTGLYLWIERYPGDADDGDRPEPAVAGDLVLTDVSFHYPSRPGAAVDRVNLRIPAGSTVAVVGENGAGKSTLVALIAGLYRPSSGVITYAGRETSACFQDFCQFELRLRETVGIGRLPAMDDPAAVRSALARAGAADLPAALPAGLDTQLGTTFPDGTDLSKGQWQKTALARARMRDSPAVLVLDEPTASLDPATETQLLESYLERPAAEPTITVIVSHRLVTTRWVDLVIVLDRGAVAEMGSHDELVRAGGRYAELYAMQASSYRDAS